MKAIEGCFAFSFLEKQNNNKNNIYMITMIKTLIWRRGDRQTNIVSIAIHNVLFLLTGNELKLYMVNFM